MATYYVEVYRPAYPQIGVKIAVHRREQFSLDALNPGMRACFRVENATSKQEAIAIALERAAGFETCCWLAHGGRERLEQEQARLHDSFA